MFRGSNYSWELQTRLSVLPHCAFPKGLRIETPCRHARTGYRTVAALAADRSTSCLATRQAALDQRIAFRAGHPAGAQASPVVMQTASLPPRPEVHWHRDTAPGNLSDRAATLHRVRAIGSVRNDWRHR